MTFSRVAILKSSSLWILYQIPSHVPDFLFLQDGVNPTYSKRSPPLGESLLPAHPWPWTMGRQPGGSLSTPVPAGMSQAGAPGIPLLDGAASISLVGAILKVACTSYLFTNDLRRSLNMISLSNLEQKCAQLLICHFAPHHHLCPLVWLQVRSPWKPGAVRTCLWVTAGTRKRRWRLACGATTNRTTGPTTKTPGTTRWKTPTRFVPLFVFFVAQNSWCLENWN